VFNYKAKFGFTVGELVLSLIIFAFGALFAVNSVFKSSKSEHAVKEINNYLICYEGKNDDEHGGRYYKNIHGCNFELTDDIQSKEFFEIKLIGGGAGATSYQNGGNGEERFSYYPSLLYPFSFYGLKNKICNSHVCADCNQNGECTKCIEGYKFDGHACKINFYYRAVLGEGGKSGENGGQTSLLVVDKSTGNILKILETASGGVISNSLESNNLVINGTTSDYNSGSGGNMPTGSGQYGEVKISW